MWWEEVGITIQKRDLRKMAAFRFLAYLLETLLLIAAN